MVSKNVNVNIFSFIVLAWLCVCHLFLVKSEYTLVDVTTTPCGLQATLSLLQNGTYGNDIPTLKLNVYYETASRLHVKITDANNARYEVSASLILTSVCQNAATNPLYIFNYTKTPFSFSVQRLDGSEIFNTKPDGNGSRPFIFEDQYIEISTRIAQNAILYGLGERIDHLALSRKQIYTIWNKDQGGNPEHLNLYGAHPYYLSMDPDTQRAHGVYLFNSNAMDVYLDETFLTYRIVGGILDFYFFMGDMPKDVTQQYTEVVGRSYVPPYWSLGFHQCRWGYKDVEELKKVVAGYENAYIPLDTIWNDIDYMETYYVFTLDPKRYDNVTLREFDRTLASRHQHHVYIVDPGVPAMDSFGPYEDGKKQDIFIRTPDNSSYILNRVWPHVNVVFPDFTHPKADDYWLQQFQKFNQSGAEFSGIWIDMNEVATFCKGEYPNECENVTGPPWSDPTSTATSFSLHSRGSEQHTQSKIVQIIGPPPYIPGNQSLNTKTLNQSSIHYSSQHYNVHNLYGILEQRATQRALEAIRGKRAFSLSRSTFAGSQRFGAHWTGDNYSTFRSMRMSVPHILTLGILGMPFVGSDICGFFGNTTNELCTRWFQLGAFYPFSRNHNMWDTIDQAPYNFPSPYVDTMRNAINTRYHLLPTIYSLLVDAHLTGLPVFRPLFFEFPKDKPEVYSIDTQFMLGDRLMIIPILNETIDSVNGFLPQTIWYNYTTGNKLANNNDNNNQIFKCGLNDPVPILLRGGKMLLRQGVALTTFDARKNPFDLLIALDDSQSAQGTFYWDDGESINNIDKNNYAIYNMQWSTNDLSAQFTIQLIQTTDLVDLNSLKLINITVYGMHENYDLSGIKMNGSSISQTLTANLQNSVLTLLSINNGTGISMGSTITFTIPKNSSSSSSSSSSNWWIIVVTLVSSALLVVIAYLLCRRREPPSDGDYKTV